VCREQTWTLHDGNTGVTEPANDTHNTVTDDRVITTNQIRELINEMKNLKSDHKKKI